MLSKDEPANSATTTKTSIATDTASSSTSTLPNGWMELVDPATNASYYYNQELNLTQWERPIATTVVEPSVDSIEETLDT